MSPLLRIFSPLRQAARAFFKQDVALRRDLEGIRLVLEDRAPDAAPAKKRPSRADASTQREREELALMLKQLRELLDEVPDTRTAMRHMAFVEQALTRKGLRALHKLPLDVLTRALEQFEGMVTNWSPVGLANLRSKMAVAIIDREHMDPDAEADAYRTAAVLEPGHDGPALPEVEDRSDDEALAAAYAALGHMAPEGVHTQAELGSQSAKAVAPAVPRPSEVVGEIRLRELQT